MCVLIILINYISFKNIFFENKKKKINNNKKTKKKL